MDVGKVEPGFQLVGGQTFLEPGSQRLRKYSANFGESAGRGYTKIEIVIASPATGGLPDQGILD